jgi:hypothetical protein
MESSRIFRSGLTYDVTQLDDIRYRHGLSVLKSDHKS